VARLYLPGAIAATVVVVGLVTPGHRALNGTARAASATTLGDPVVFAAGDIACDPTNSGFNGGNGTSKRCQELWTAAELGSADPTAVLPLGDEQYNCGTLSATSSTTAEPSRPSSSRTIPAGASTRRLSIPWSATTSIT
jgi:hypothetical protein